MSGKPMTPGRAFLSGAYTATTGDLSRIRAMSSQTRRGDTIRHSWQAVGDRLLRVSGQMGTSHRSQR